MRLTVALVLCGAAVLSAADQQTTFKSSIELIHVDVTVVDARGSAVHGLTAADFALTDRKKPQAIATFTEESHGRGDSAAADTAADPLSALPPTVRRDVSSNTTVQADRLVMLVIDGLHIWKDRTDRAKSIARSIVTDLGGQASMAVVFTSGEGGTQVTADRSTLLAAIDKMRGRQSVRRPHQATDTQRAAAIDPESPANPLDVVAKSQSVVLQDFEDNMRQIRTMNDAAKMLRREDQRRKAFVLISEGFSKSMNGVFDAEMTPCESGGGECYHDRELKLMMESLRRSNVTTYAIDPRGKIRPEDMMLESFPPPDCGACAIEAPDPNNPAERMPPHEDSQFRWNNPIRQAQDALSLVSEATGGFAVTDSNDFTGGLKRIIEDIDHYYVLGFYPPDPNSTKYRPLGVTVPGHPDWTVRFRHGYVAGAPPAEAPDKDPLVELSRGVMPKTGLPLRLTALPLVGDGRTSAVAVSLEISAPTGAMKDADAKLRDDVSYAVLVVDENRAKVASRTGRSAKLSLSAAHAQGPMPETVTYQIPMTLDLPPGRYQFRASAESKKLQRGGSVYLDVTVPDFRSAPLILSSIALGYADGARVPVGREPTPVETIAAPRTIQPGTAPRVGLTPPPADTPTPAPARVIPGVIPFDPSLDRQFTAADTVRAYFEVARADAATTVHMTMTIVDASGRSVMAIEREVAPKAPGHVDVRVPLAPLGPGPYRLRVAATDGRHVAQSETGFLIK
jgi:VWFA-related protein